MFYKKIIYIVIILLLLNFQVFSNIMDARSTNNSGKFVESINLYNSWLENNSKSKEFSSILIEISQLNGDIFLIIETLENYIEKVTERPAKKILYGRLAQMYELSSNLQKAQVYYQKSALISLDKIDTDMLLKSAGILILEGDLYRAESQLEEIIEVSKDQNILHQANTLNKILYILNSKNISENNIQYKDNPESLYISYLIAKSDSNISEMDNIEKQIYEKFGTSPEAGLINNKFHELPDILTVFGLLQKNNNLQRSLPLEGSNQVKVNYNYMIQAGSFKDKENAHYLSKDLEDSGFSTTVEEQTINNIQYFKVILYLATEEEIEKTLVELKSKGFDGFPIY